MTDSRDFKNQQRGVALAMAGALVTTIYVLGAITMWDPTAKPVLFADRLQSTLRADLFVIGWLAAAVANVARLRFFSERDIAGSNTDSESAEVRQGSVRRSGGEFGQERPAELRI